MRKYLKQSLHWLHLAVFKPITLEKEAAGLSRKQAVLTSLRVLPVQLVVVVSVVALIGVLFEFAGLPLDWQRTILTVLIIGSSFGLMGLLPGVEALGFILVFQLVFGMGFGVFSGSPGSFGLGLGFGVLMGWVLETSARHDIGPKDVPKPIEALVWPVVGSLCGPVVALLFLGLGLLERLSGLPSRLVTIRSWREIPLFGVGYAVAFLVAYLRPFYIVPYAFQRWRSKRAADPFACFLNSPVYWDEAIAMPLPFLSDWLVRLAMFDRQRGMAEIAQVAKLPHQRRAAHIALIAIVAADLQHANSFEKIASTPEVLAALPSYAKLAALPSFSSSVTGLNYVTRPVRRIADLTGDYLTRVTTVGQLNVLRELRTAVDSFRDAMVLVKPPLGPAFESAAVLWLDIVNAEEARCRALMVFAPIPNPFVVGNPLMVRDHILFKGRKDIIVAIEENIINPAQRPALLLYGRRRIGKTSTLLNLPSLLSSQFVPVFIDCQDAKWREGDAAFCYHLAASIHSALNNRELVAMRPKPQLEQFERYAFTRLGEYLDQIEEESRAAHKQILLTFDEYEKLEPGSDSKVSTEVLNQLRSIAQHRNRIVVLFSGGHRFEEMRTINWSDYLINVKSLELSYLAPKDARELITEPVPLLQYESGVIEQIIEMTHCQPYLLQAVASDLVNYLNSEKRMVATAADLEVAVEKVLVTAQAYFFYTWTGDCSEAEREVLRMIAIGDTNNGILAEHQASLQSLCHKDILERHASGYRFSIELFRRWVLKNQTAQPFTPGELPEPSELEYAAS